MSHQPQLMSREGIEAIQEFLEAGKHLTASGNSITLRAFKSHFDGCSFSPKAIVETYFPDIAKDMHAASFAAFLRGSRGGV